MEIFGRRYKLSPLVVTVIFITFFHNVLSKHRIRHFNDRFKRQQGANLYLPGSYVQDNNDQESGPWEEWSAPSPCSRTCGGGVSTQRRRCTDGYECSGPSAKHVSCNTQDCPDLGDYRAQQCADHNNVPFDGAYYEWVPYTKAPKPCELNCMAKGERFYYRHAEAVVDGTRCNDEEFDVCVEGKCQPVGCDRMLGSNAREDNCRVCGGDGSTCNTFSNTIPMKDMQVGYNDILLIPAGATNIRIEELAPSNNYLAVRNKTGFYHLNGNWKIDFPRSLDFAGTRFKYDRQPQEFDAPDILTALGPTDESLFIVLLYQGADVPISYSYSLPTSVPPPSTETYAWTYDEFSPCTASCGRGVQYRNVSCAGRNSLEPADPSLCDKETKPQEFQYCNQFDCKASWMIQPWGACSYPCGKGGVKTRQVTCQKIGSSGLPELVNDEVCARSEPKPIAEEKCNEGKTCAKWFTDPWKPCDHMCGPGKQTRKVFCYDEKNGKKEILDNSECLQVETKPEEEKDCSIRPCEGVDWLMSQWSGCDKCGLTNETRKVFCSTASGEIQPEELCDPDTKPEVVRECETMNNTCQYSWYASQWSECSASCGQGVQTRTVFCGVSTVDGVKKAENDKCDQSKNFETMKNCTAEQETCDGEWFSGPWGECSKPCGGGERTKKVVCIKDNIIVESSSCDSSKIEFSEETCNQQPCSEDTIMPTDITQAVDESEPTKETSQKREATTPLSTDIPESSESPEVSSGFEITTEEATPLTTENPDDFEIVPDDNCDDGEWVEVDDAEDDDSLQTTTETLQGDDPSAYDFMMGDQAVLILVEDDEEGSSSSSSTWSTDSSTSTDSTWSTESTLSTEFSLSTSEFDGSGATPIVDDIGESEAGEKKYTKADETTNEFTGPTESTESTTEYTGPTESTQSTVEFTGSTESTESTTEFTGPTESTESTTEGATETTTEFTGSTESTESTTEGATETTTEFTGSTESTEGTTEGATESTTEFTGSTESTESTTEGATESTTEFTGSTESTESTTEGATESTTEFTGSTESTDSTTSASTETTTEFTGSSESTESTTEFTGSTESTESTTEFTGSTESTESTTEFTGSTESTESTTEGITQSTSEFTGSTETSTEFTGSTESTESTSEFTGSTESTTEFTGSTETSTEFTGSTESSTEFTGSTESTTDFTGSTESTSEFTGSTESTESTTEFTGSTESSTEFGTTSIMELFQKKPRMCKRRKVKACKKSKFGCCWDNITPANGPFDKGCPMPHTCKEAKYGCCDDGVSAALGPKKAGCPRSQCKETIFGCCPDNKTPAEGNDNEGCPPECLSSKFGCCDDNSTAAEGPNHKGCPEESTTIISTEPSEVTTVSGETEITSEGTTETGVTTETTTIETDCESTPYRCCPDAVTPAKGPGFQGCNLPCSEAKFGCCQDAKTPAHGPSGEGCCLSSAFGCCPDNITPARGPNNSGCECQFTPYGCCPDNKTAAQGYEKEGCGCDYSEFGCCPDGHTRAQGADLQGCPCSTFQFGCCPDGITSAQGPYGQGCGCRNSEFGCCSDEKTAASGPNHEGCGCENTKFGCCPNGITEAKGEHFEECTDIPKNLQVGCSLPKERGGCRNYTVKWFFDLDYGGCSRFWYGGCDGNENRYKSKEECDQTCVSPEGVGRCQLPKVAGPCEGYYPQWYYDKNLKTCTQFVYGGCLGNNNRFETREECLGLCVKDSGSDPCQQPEDEGPCHGSYQRFFFDKDSGDCREFIYGGCKGNNNNFATVEACRQQCSPPGQMKDLCTAPKAEGNCTEVYANWFYDTSKKSCEPFYYTGCNGNPNNFDSKEACEAQCPPQIEVDTCHLPAETGECGNYVDRWYYDTREKSCRQFYYGGCGGNGNNFETQQSCQRQCEEQKSPEEPVEPVVPVDIPTEPSTNPQPFTTEQCFLPSETGPCRAAFTKYYYDANDGVCKSFIYGGCRGNGNMFDRIEDCLQNCGNAKDLCTLPPVQGTCGGQYPQFYYDQASDTCREFIFSGCGGNYNRFQDKQSCEQRCKRAAPEPTYTQAPTSASETVMCFESPQPGNCLERITAFYYDPTRRVCQPFVYSGCGGNNNRFNSEEQCQRQCGEFRNQDVCNMQRDPGPCRGYFVKYYYDSSRGGCNQFAYGGCQGNGNRFSTEEECAQICITHHEIQPNLTASALCRLPVDTGSCQEGYHKRWYFDDSRGECRAFIFSGCGGNFNNFKSYRHCLEYCSELLPPPVEPQIVTDMPPHPCQAAFDECTTMRCPYGVEPFVDENDCNRCRCRDPCVEIECLQDEQCAIDLNRNKTTPADADFIAICRKRNKPGLCPTLDIKDENCEEECRTDADCTLHLKCCSSGCGTACVDPTPPGQLVTQQYQPAYTEGPLEAKYQPPRVDPIEYEPEIAASIGDQATLRCAVSGNPNPKISWSKDNIEIDGTQPRYRIKLDQSLQIITLHKTDSGIYLCTANNGVGDPLTNEIKLEVLDSEPRPVSILAEQGDEQPVVVSLNAPATLNCYALGFPFPTVTWWKDDEIVPFKNNEFEIRKDYSLLIHSVQLQNLGIYTCQAYNGLGKAASWSVTVKTRGPIGFDNEINRPYNKFIIYPEEPSTPSTPVPRREVPYTPYVPTYTEPSNEIIPNTLPDAQVGRPPPTLAVPVRANITMTDRKYPEGSTIEIPCEYSGYPQPQVQWYKDGISIQLYETDKIHIRETQRISVLTVERATKGDSGIYQCQATNAYNKVENGIEISVEGMYIHPSCTDNQFFANCALIVKAKYCTHKYYAKFCCRSCTEAGLLPVNGPHLDNLNRQNFLNNNII